MKKGYSYILILFAIIPILGWGVFNGTTNTEAKYHVSNELGDRNELGNVKFQTYQKFGACGVNFISLGKKGIEVSKANYIHDYGEYKNIVQNKELLRGKTIRDEFIDENNKYTVYACVEQDKSKSYIDLNIKNKESGKIIRTKYDVKAGVYTGEVRIIDNYVEVMTEGYSKSKGIEYDLIKSYKFDLNSGKLIEESLVTTGLPVMKTIRGEQGKYYLICAVENEIKEDTNYMIIYDSIHDKSTKVNLPKEIYQTSGTINNGKIYFCTQECDIVLAVNEQGEVVKRYKIDVKEKNDQRSMIINNDKVYFTQMIYKPDLQDKISVYSLNNGKCLYSGIIRTEDFCYELPKFTVQ